MRKAWMIWTTCAVLVAAAMTANAQGKSPQRAVAKARRAADRAVMPPDALIGEWWTEGREGRVRFERLRNGTYRGIATWRKPGPATEDNPTHDLHNPNPKLRGRSTIGIVLIWNLTFDDGEYEDGYVYNPRDGDTYRFKAELLSHDTLKIRGFLGISLFGQNQIWKRYR